MYSNASILLMRVWRPTAVHTSSEYVSTVVVARELPLIMKSDAQTAYEVRRRSACRSSPGADSRTAFRAACYGASCFPKSGAGCCGICPSPSAELHRWTSGSCSWAAIPETNITLQYFPWRICVIKPTKNIRMQYTFGSVWHSGLLSLLLLGLCTTLRIYEFKASIQQPVPCSRCGNRKGSVANSSTCPRHDDVG